MPVTEVGLKIRDVFYPFPGSATLDDGVLIKRLTGMKPKAFAAELAEFQKEMADGTATLDDMDPGILLGLIGWTISRGQPSWDQDRVIKYVKALELDNFEIVVPEESEEDEANPPEVSEAVAPTSPTSSKKPSESSESK
jgi:hypothetical protein